MQGLLRHPAGHKTVCSSVPELLSRSDTSAPGEEEEEKISTPRSFYGLNGQTVAGFPQPVQSSLPGNCRVALPAMGTLS